MHLARQVRETIPHSLIYCTTAKSCAHACSRDGRLAILRVHAKKLVLESNVKLDIIASMSNNLSGADLATLTNEAAIRAVRRGAEAVSQRDFYDAFQSFVTSRGIQFGNTNLGGVADLIEKLIGRGSSGDDFVNGKPAYLGN
jgi:hypothetical protein